jgi:hypothetical protein
MSLVEDKWKNRVILAEESPEMYRELTGKWLLIEALETGKSGKATRFYLIKTAKRKDELLDYLMDDENRDWKNRLVIVFADPDKVCEI